MGVIFFSVKYGISVKNYDNTVAGWVVNRVIWQLLHSIKVMEA